MAISMERSLELWGEEIQRQGLDLADRVTQSFAALVTSHVGPPPSFPWPSPKIPFAALDIGARLGRAGAELGSGLHGAVHQLLRRIQAPFRPDDGRDHAEIAVGEDMKSSKRDDGGGGGGGGGGEAFGLLGEQLGGAFGLQDDNLEEESMEDFGDEEEGFGSEVRASGSLKRPRGSYNIVSTYDSRTQEIESSLVARGDLWRVEASKGGSTLGNEHTSLFLLQLGPVLFVRDSTLLLPVHLSNQHLLWYGYDRKNRMHSLCPALWSKHRRCLLMSMFCLNPLACSFMDLQFPNGQLTYVAGEGLTTSTFFPVCGGLLQAQGRYPGETKFSFSCKNRKGTRITPVLQWPDKSFSLGITHDLAWRRSGLMVRPTIQFSIRPTFGGSNPGLCAELFHSVMEELNLVFGYAATMHPSAYASLSLGRSKWNGHVGNSGVVVRVESPLNDIGRAFFSIQLNSGFEF